MTRAVGYVRLSNLTEQTTSPARQREQIESYARARGWELVQIVEDLGESGSRVGKGLERPGLQAIRERWEAGEQFVLVVAKLDRLARNVRDFATIAEDAQAHGCSLAVVTEGLDLSTPTGRFVATILAAFAEMEAEQIRERIVAMRADVRSNHAGRYMGGTVPYGYRAAPRPEGGKTLVLDEAEAARVVEAASRVLEGHTLYSIVMDWNRAGVPSKKGGTWSTVTLHTLLTGYAVLGVQSHGGEPVRDEGGTLLAAFPPVLDTGTWGEVRGILERNQRGPRRRAPAQLLAGLARCGVCGNTLYSRTQRGRAPIYQCNGRGQGNGCTLGGVTVHNLDAEVVRQFLNRCRNHVILRRVQQQSDNSVQLAEVEDAIRATTRQLAEDDGPGDTTLARLAELKGRRAQLRTSPGSADVLDWLGYADAYWQNATLAERTALLRQVLDAVLVTGGHRHGGVFDPDRVTLEWSETAAWTGAQEAEGEQVWLVLGGMPAGSYTIRGGAPLLD